MVFQELLKNTWSEKRYLYSILFGAVFTFIGFVTSYVLFRDAPNFIGIGTVLFTVIISIPIVNRLFNMEENIEANDYRSFFNEHEAIIDFFQYFFLGVFVVLFIIALVNPQYILTTDHLTGIDIEISESASLNSVPNPRFEISSSQKILSGEFVFIFANNLYVMGVAFILSIFYGAGAIFLIIFNGSIFAGALADVVLRKLPPTIFGIYSYIGCNLGIMFIHMVPEVAAYLIAAIAGGVLSKALISEKWKSLRFYRVLKDSIYLLVLAIIVLFVAAWTEVNVSKELFGKEVCLNSQPVLVLTVILLLGLGVFYELYRKKFLFRKSNNYKKSKIQKRRK